MKPWIIYGANGYTGRLIVAAAAARGHRPVIAGRNRAEVAELASKFGLESRVFALDDPAELIRALEGMFLVLHCAGPFSATSQPMIEGCLETGVHYLDITGEISVFENAWRQSDVARKRDVILCPGVGFDVVPTDCLAAALVKQLPAATELVLAFEPGGGPSRGTAKSGVEGLGNGGCVRKNGELKRVPLAWKTRQIPFDHAERTAVTIPWGDVFTAWVSTGVPDVEVYMSVPRTAVRKLRRLRFFQPLLRLRWVQSFLKKRVNSRAKGPDSETRARNQSHIWGEVRSADARSVSGTLVTPNGYDLTVTASLGIVEHLLKKNDHEGGYLTPSLLLGADYVTTLPGVEMRIGTPD